MLSGWPALFILPDSDCLAYIKKACDSVEGTRASLGHISETLLLSACRQTRIWLSILSLCLFTSEIACKELWSLRNRLQNRLVFRLNVFSQLIVWMFINEQRCVSNRMPDSPRPFLPMNCSPWKLPEMLLETCMWERRRQQNWPETSCTEFIANSLLGSTEDQSHWLI